RRGPVRPDRALDGQRGGAAELRQEHAVPGARADGPCARHDRGWRDPVRAGAWRRRTRILMIAQLYRYGLRLIAPISIAAAFVHVALGLLYALLTFTWIGP